MSSHINPSRVLIQSVVLLRLFCISLSPVLCFQAHCRPIKQIFRCEGPGSDSSRVHPKAGDLLQTEQSATITS